MGQISSLTWGCEVILGDGPWQEARPGPEPLSPGQGRLAMSRAPSPGRGFRDSRPPRDADYRGAVEQQAPAHGRDSGMSITQVQQWILSVLAFTVIEHFAAGLAIAGIFADDQDARVGLNVLAGITGVFAVLAFRALRAKPLLSVWLLLGPLPGVVGAWVTFR